MNAKDILFDTRLSKLLNSKESTCNAGDTGDTGSVPGLGRSTGRWHGNPLHYSCLEIPWTEELAGCSCKESDMTEQLTLTHSSNSRDRAKLDDWSGT